MNKSIETDRTQVIHSDTVKHGYSESKYSKKNLDKVKMTCNCHLLKSRLRQSANPGYSKKIYGDRGPLLFSGSNEHFFVSLG